MKITYMGHAGYSIQIAGVHILIDPILTKTFQNGTAAVYPPCQLELDHLPPVDALIITHSHPGHLEIPTLSYLPRSTSVFYPSDSTIELVLKNMGFVQRTVLEPGEVVHFSGVKFTVTGSSSGWPEIGCFFQEDNSSCWYIGDTLIDKVMLEGILQNVGNPNLLICNFPGYHHRFFTNFQLDFPLHDLSNTLNTVLEIKPDVLIPNYTGLQYLGNADWINRFMFPMSADQFIEEILRLRPNQRAASLQPGDEIEINSDTQVIHKASSQFVKSQCNKVQPLLFDPTLELPALQDPNPEGLSYENLRKRITNFLNEDFISWLQTESNKKSSLLSLYQKLNVRFRIIIVFQEEIEESWLVKMEFNKPTIEAESFDDIKYPTQIGVRIAASILDRWIRAEIPYYYVYYYARPYGNLYRTGCLSDGTVKVEELESRDLLSLYFNSDVNRVYHPWLLKQIARYTGGKLI
ncbi:MBL fold metallo-hydrolase [Bacillus sp. IBL03825]|uniref:MBL fold metallo-hydrolase n=1 Tax=Bacillus sp. IBL03825 TaxID=2953580 RepID=UPI0021579DF9|nr:MBL fold metallo-hydrolase [Bacillus sp. IBL03825]MCR6850386.1 MBL fold metallo-hydrolase [Bacillus sp. IBL03825]